MDLKILNRVFRYIRTRDFIQLFITLALVYIIFHRRGGYSWSEKERPNNEDHDLGDARIVVTQSKSTSTEPKKALNPFVIISNGRAGTHFMMNLLNNHPDVKTYDELLQTEILLKPKGIMGNKTAILKYLSEELCRLKRFCEQDRKVGFILLNWQISKLASFLSLNEILEHLGDPKIIVQYRVNTLLSYTSLQLIKENGVTNSNVSNNNLSVEINWRKFENYLMRKRTEWGDTLKCIANRTKTFISYEELMADQKLSMRRLFKYIAVPEYSGPLVSKITKLNPTALEERISNYAGIKENIEAAPRKLLQLNLATEKDVTTLYDDDADDADKIN